MIAQLEQQTDLFTPRPMPPGNWLAKLLFDQKTWLTAAEILNLLGKEPTEDLKRWLRDEVKNTKYIVSGPGSPGYKHMAHCTLEQINHYSNSRMSQGKDMILGGIKMRREAHELFG